MKKYLVKKYLVVGTYVKSSDGDTHFISANRLCELYGLNPKDNNVKLVDLRKKEAFLGYDDTWIRLYPDPFGLYKLK